MGARVIDGRGLTAELEELARPRDVELATMPVCAPAAAAVYERRCTRLAVADTGGGAVIGATSVGSVRGERIIQ